MPSALGSSTSTIRPGGIVDADAGTLGCVLEAAQPSPGAAQYLLTCSHVLRYPGFPAGNGTVLDEAGQLIAKLALASDPTSQGIDVAIAQLESSVNPAFGDLGMARGWTWFFDRGDRLRAATPSQPGGFTSLIRVIDQSATLSVTGPAGSRILLPLSGVILADPAQFKQGDSGTIVLNDDQFIVGVYGGTFEGQAVITPIKVALDWLKASGFDLQPVIDRGLLPASPSDPLVGVPADETPPWPDAVKLGPPVPSSPDDMRILANTLFSEAENQLAKPNGQAGGKIGDLAYRAIAEVIINRQRQQKVSIAAICQQAGQFDGLTKRAAAIAAAEATLPPAYRTAQTVAAAVVAGWSGNLTHGAKNYFAPISMNPPGTWPRWALDATGARRQPCYVLGDHLFFNDVV